MTDEKPWQAALRQSVKGELDQALEGQSKFTKDLLEVELMAAVLPHMATSFKVGGMKASARIGSRLVQKNLELSRKLRLAREELDRISTLDTVARDSGRADSFDTGARWTVRMLRDVLGEDEGPTSAEQEVRAKALEEAAEALPSALDWTPEASDVVAMVVAHLQRLARPAVREDGKYGRPDCPVGGHAFPEVVCDDRCQVQADALDKLRAALDRAGL